MNNIKKKKQKKIREFLEEFNPYIKIPIGILYPKYSPIPSLIEEQEYMCQKEIDNLPELSIEYNNALKEYIIQKYKEKKKQIHISNYISPWDSSEAKHDENNLRLDYLKEISKIVSVTFQIETKIAQEIVVGEIGDGIILQQS